MAQPPISLEVHQPLYVHADSPPQFAFHRDIFFNVVPDFIYFFFCELVRVAVWVHGYGLKNSIRQTSAYSKNIGKANFNPFVAWKVYPCDTCHLLPLPLLVSGV